MNRLLLVTMGVGAQFACGSKPAPATPTSATTVTTAATNASADAAAKFRAEFRNTGGMWLPRQMALPAHADMFRNMGAALPAERFSDPLAAPLGAVVSLGGCTGSFVSPDGLVVTNHHCVQSVLQHNATPENNLVETGFLAKTRADEPSAGPAQRIMVQTAYRDVTANVRDGLAAIFDPAARTLEVERRTKQLVSECEKGRTGVRCSVASLFRGDEYQLQEFLEIRDVRLVYAPHRAIGNFGGEIDNWAWPRHTGDFAFLRAYVGTDGAPADYAPTNVPFRPKHWLQVTTAGVRPFDMVIVAGYPGRTERTNTAAAVQHDIEWYYPYVIGALKDRYAVADALISRGGDVAIKAGVAKQNIQNGLEKMQGVYAGLIAGPYLHEKLTVDAAVRAWAAGAGREGTAAALAELDTLETAQRQSARADLDRNLALGASKLLSTALTIVRLAEERTKPDAERKAGYQERDMSRLTAGQKSLAKAYNPELDRAMLRLLLIRAAALPAPERPWLNALLGVSTSTKVTDAVIEKKLAAAYARSKLSSEALRLRLLTAATPASLQRERDPFIEMARRIWPIYKAEEQKAEARAGALLLVAPAYAAALRDSTGGLLAPDANSTLRVTYGTVRAFVPGSTKEADWPFTTGKQLLAKVTAADPFDAPPQQVAALRARNYGGLAVADLGDELPVNFLSNLDTTGGNSGSPTLNSRGELVGVGFDGTIDRVASDVIYRSDQGRTIHCDARYMVWVLHTVDRAHHLLAEMGVAAP